MNARPRYWMLLLALAMVLAACGGDDDGGGEAAGDGDEDGDGGEAAGEEIVIGGIFDLTGPTGDVGTPYSQGVRDYFTQFEDEGGIEGRPVRLAWQDYQYDVAIAEQLYAQYTGEGAVAILGWGTADTEALRSQVTADELPFFSGSLSEELADPAETPYNFLVGTTYSDQMRIALAYIAENSPGASVAVFYNDSPFGESPLADGESYIEEEGLDLTYETYAMPTGATDFVAELTQAEGATHIIIQNVASPAAQLAQNVASQGLDVQIVCLNWCSDELFAELAGDAAEGVIGVTPWAPATVEADGLAAPAAYLEEAGGSVEEAGGHYLQGWYYAELMLATIVELVDGGEEVTGPGIKEALETRGAFETGGVSPPIEFSAESHKGMLASPIFQVTDGAWVEIVEPTEP